jgi:hypothetical protein
MTEVSMPVGNIVICDACNTDYTNSNATGGMIFCSWAICPVCEPKWLQWRDIRPGVRPSPWQSFRELVIGYRGTDAAIKIGPAK